MYLRFCKITLQKIPKGKNCFCGLPRVSSHKTKLVCNVGFSFEVITWENKQKRDGGGGRGAIILQFWRHISLKLDSLGICNKPKCWNEEKAPFKDVHLGEHATGNPLILFNTSKQ